MEQLKELLSQLQVFETREDLIPNGKAINDLKILFEDTLLEEERLQQIAALEARERGESFDSLDFTEVKQAFLGLYKTLHEQRKQQLVLKEALEKENLKLKKNLIEDLKKIIESEEHIGSAFNAYKSIHETWKKVGDIPREYRDTLQKEYSRLIEIFFYTMRIYQEIKSHDYKRNLQNKQLILHKLQQLRNEEEDIKTVEQQLRVLQDEWEEIGPVPNEEWEAIKAKYWEIVRQIYDKINAHYEAQRQEYEKNIEAKKALVQELQGICDKATTASSFKEWDALVEQVKTIQEAYKKVGPGARKENESLWKQFRAANDAFFELKKNNAKEQQALFSERIEAKKNVITEAAQLKITTDWKEATHRIIQLQKQWKTLGNTGRAENKLWSQFREACDAFFAAKDSANAEAEKALEVNFQLKQAVIEKIKTFQAEDKSEGLTQLKAFSAEFTAIGHVPIAQKDFIYNEYKAALDQAYEGLKLNEKEREHYDFKAKVDQILTSNDRDKQLQRERMELRKNIERHEQEINRMETNLAFFARSKGADALRQEVAIKVKGIQDQITTLKQRLKMLPNE
jgi:hypothetical protein